MWMTLSPLLPHPKYYFSVYITVSLSLTVCPLPRRCSLLNEFPFESVDMCAYDVGPNENENSIFARYTHTERKRQLQAKSSLRSVHIIWFTTIFSCHFAAAIVFFYPLAIGGFFFGSCASGVVDVCLSFRSHFCFDSSPVPNFSTQFFPLLGARYCCQLPPLRYSHPFCLCYACSFCT